MRCVFQKQNLVGTVTYIFSRKILCASLDTKFLCLLCLLILYYNMEVSIMLLLREKNYPKVVVTLISYDEGTLNWLFGSAHVEKALLSSDIISFVLQVLLVTVVVEC